MVAAANLATPQLIRVAIDVGFTQAQPSALVEAVAGLIALALVRGLFTFLQGYLAERASQGGAYDLRDLTLASLRGQISIVLQEALLFGGSVRDNIACGKPDATQAEIEAAARAAQAHAFIAAFPIYVQQFFRPIQLVSQVYTQLRAAPAGAERIYAILDEPEEPPDHPNHLDVVTTSHHTYEENHVVSGPRLPANLRERR